MKLRSLIVVLTAFIVFSCSPLKKLPGLENQANSAIEQKNYWQAYDYLKQYMEISKAGDVEITPSVIRQMAQVCTELNKVEEATDYYEQLLSKNTDNNTIQAYASLLRNNDKLEEELQLWKRFSTKLNDQQLETEAFNRQILIAKELEKQEDVMAIWKTKPEAVTPSAEAQYTYIWAAEKAGDEKAALKACNQLLKADPDNAHALEWKARHISEKAEQMYQSEMNKYNKNKNATTYAYLRRELKKISADFRTARNLFEKLHRMNPEEKTYIRYLKNIYLRLNMKDQAAKMDRLLK